MLPKKKKKNPTSILNNIAVDNVGINVTYLLLERFRTSY